MASHGFRDYNEWVRASAKADCRLLTAESLSRLANFRCQFWCQFALPKRRPAGLRIQDGRLRAPQLRPSSERTSVRSLRHFIGLPAHSGKVQRLVANDDPNKVTGITVTLLRRLQGGDHVPLVGGSKWT